MITSLHKDEDGTIKLTITIPLDLVKKTRIEVVDDFSKHAELPGFRKGKAPKKLVEEHLSEEKINEEILKKLIPQTYLEAVKEHTLKPITSPKIHVTKLDDNPPVGGWQFDAILCEAPKVELNSYKENVKKITAKSKIVLPGKEPAPPKFEDIVKTVLESVSVTVPKVLLDSEADRLLAQLLDEIKKLGLTLDQYLASTNRTAQDLRNEYVSKAQSDIKFEFALSQIAEEEHISVDEKEIEEAIRKATSEQEKKHLKQNRYLLASILRQQKTLDFLKNL